MDDDIISCDFPYCRRNAYAHRGDFHFCKRHYPKGSKEKLIEEGWEFGFRNI